MAIVPIWSRGAPRTMRWLGDIYTGQNGTGRYVPNPNDIIYDRTLGFYWCLAVDESTGLSEIAPWDDPSAPAGVRPEDVLMGVGPGYQSETFRIMVNNKVLPRRMWFDGRLHTYALDAAYCVVYLGTDIEQNPIAISAYYDENMNPVDERIPLILAEESDTQNYTKKVPVPGWCNRALVSGQPLTVVMYSDSGRQLSVQVLLARDTAFIPAGNTATRRITGIGIDSPYLSATESNTINIPLDTTIESLALRGVLQYNTGPQLLALDGSKFKLDGIENFTASYADQRHPLTLTYLLGPGEAADEAVQLPNGSAHISESWWARIVESPGGRNVKLFVQPSWDTAALRWRLDYFLYFAERGTYYYVNPSLIETGTNSTPFDPVNYQIVQHLTVAVQTDQVHPSLPKHRHVQSFDIALTANGVNPGTDTRWYLYYTPFDPTSAYGQNLFCQATLITLGELWELRIDCGLPNLTEWLEQVFYKTQPIYDRKVEARAPQPTHFILSINGLNTEYPISAWNSVLPSETGGAQSGVAILHFIARVGNTDLQLGASPLRVVQVI